jgi:hypothetical protein
MASMYPANLDNFRRYLNDFDRMIGEDMDDLFDTIVAIETELGIETAGSSGTLFSRIFGGRGANLDQVTGGWKRLAWDRAAQFNDSRVFARTTNGFRITYQQPKFKGNDTVWGEDIPAAFGRLQEPMEQGLGVQRRGALPWRVLLADVKESWVSWIARDGNGDEITSQQSGRWGYIIWSLLA